MKAFSRMIVAGCLLCTAPLVLACDMEHHGECAGESFKAMDKNGDGVISKKEFLAFHEALFKKMDANHDGKLTPEEMEGAHESTHAAMKDDCDVSFDQRFDEVDINHDGGLSKDEAEIGMPMLFKHFDEIDTNKDGKITKEEIAVSMKKMHHKMDKINEDHGDEKKPEEKQ
jgi:Ca2+-binding EF-hand superfamily protein